MSEHKRRKIARLLSAPPEHVSYVAADLLDMDLEQRLSRHGYDLCAPPLLILSGVTAYLDENAVGGVLAFAGRHAAPGTTIVFDSAHGARQMRERVRSLGEPVRFGIPAGGAARLVEGLGLTLVDDLHPDDLAARYLRRADGSVAGRPYGFSALAHARVAPALTAGAAGPAAAPRPLRSARARA